MAVKKTVAKKVAAKKKPGKKSLVKKSAATKNPKLECGICGFAVTVDTECGCVEEHPLICCGKKMAKKK
jgi:hypothetical protein